MLAATSYASNQYGLEIRLWAHWIRSNPSDMCSSSLRGFTKLSKSDPGKSFQTQTCGASEIPTFLTLQYNQSNQYFYDQRRVIYFYGANT